MPCDCTGMLTSDEEDAKKIEQEILLQYPSLNRITNNDIRPIERVCRLCRFLSKDALDMKINNYPPGLLYWYECHLISDIEYSKKELERIKTIRTNSIWKIKY
jgi:hypothetical protein